MTDVVRYVEPDPAWVSMMPSVVRLAEYVAGTEFVPKGLRGRPAAVAAAILYGHELGLGPMTSLDGIDVIEGRPQPTAELMRALVLRAGHELLVTTSTAARAVVTGRRSGESATTSVTWTIDQARAAGLLGKDNWRKYPAQMLVARASADLCRQLFPDVIGGLSTDEPSDPAVGVPALEQPEAGRTASLLPPASDGFVELSAARDFAEQTDADSIDDGPAEPGPTKAQLKAMGAVFTSRGIKSRDDRLALVTLLVGRPVDSASELTKSEATRLLDDVDQVTFVEVDGAWDVIYRDVEPPDEDES